MTKRIFFLVLLSVYFFSCNELRQQKKMEPGELVFDSDGNPVNAHGGGILYHEGKYFWYGEVKK